MAYKHYLFDKTYLNAVPVEHWGYYGGPPCGMTDYGDYVVCTVNTATPNKAAPFEGLEPAFSSEDITEFRQYLIDNGLLTID